MSYQRIDRISEEVRREVDAIIREEVNDPRVSGTFSVTRAEVTRDLRYAKIYISVLEEDKREPMMQGAKSAAGVYPPGAWEAWMLIRYSPEMSFVSDGNIAYGVHIAEVLRKAQEAEERTSHGDENDQ